MFEVLSAIILKSFHPDRACLFTRTRGKIFCSFKGSKIKMIPGSLLTGSLRVKGNEAFVFDSLDTVIYPDITQPDDLAWLHHLLELYYYFQPELQVSPHDYDDLILYMALSCVKNVSIDAVRRLAVTHFLAKTGFYESKSLYHYAKKFEEVIDPALAAEVLSFNYETDLVAMHKLILRCLQEHPQFNRFKTIPFLYGSC